MRVTGQDELCRVAIGLSGEIEMGRHLQGRGAWICAGSASCLDRALRRGGWPERFARRSTKVRVSAWRCSCCAAQANRRRNIARSRLMGRETCVGGWTGRTHGALESPCVRHILTGHCTCDRPTSKRERKGSQKQVAKKIRVYELARELGLTNKEALDLCIALGIGVKSHSSSIEDAQADRVRRKADAEGLRREVAPPEPEPEPKAPARAGAGSGGPAREPRAPSTPDLETVAASASAPSPAPRPAPVRSGSPRLVTSRPASELTAALRPPAAAPGPRTQSAPGTHSPPARPGSPAGGTVPQAPAAAPASSQTSAPADAPAPSTPTAPPRAPQAPPARARRPAQPHLMLRRLTTPRPRRRRPIPVLRQPGPQSVPLVVPSRLLPALRARLREGPSLRLLVAELPRPRDPHPVAVQRGAHPPAAACARVVVQVPGDVPAAAGASAGDPAAAVASAVDPADRLLAAEDRKAGGGRLKDVLAGAAGT